MFRRLAFVLIVAVVLMPGCKKKSPPSHTEEGIELGFTGISLDFEGQAGVDYVVERLWHDRTNDDDAVIYVRGETPIVLAHNPHNVVGANTPWVPGLHQGTIVYKIDGDGLRGYDGNIYHAAPANGQPIEAPLDQIQFQYAEPFTLSDFVGRTGPGDDFHWGVVDAFGDEWHVLSFWDVDPENSAGERDDQTNDGKLVHLVVNPVTPAITFDATGGEEYYTTPPKLYYTPFVHSQRTVLTAGVEIRLWNITDDAQIHFQVDDGPVQTYGGMLLASELFGEGDRVYDLTYWLGDNGAPKLRQVHYEPAQPAPDEVHPRMLFASPAALAEAQAVVAAGGVEAEALLEPPHYIAMPDPPVDFHTGLRYLRADLFNGGYYYQTKNLAAVIKEYARVGALLQDEELLRRAVDGLLFLYTIDPLGCESFDGRSGGPCQERCMYSDGRVTIDAAIAYDLLAGFFTRDNGWARGMTPVEHIKIRDNIAGEAVMMVQFPTSAPEPFWRTSRSTGSPRNVQLELFIASLAMAVPTYDSPHFGTSGADGVTPATHLHTPLSDTAISWIELNNSGYVEHPTDPERFRHSAIHNLVDEDGAYVGGARDGYLTMMHQDIIPLLRYRERFDGHHYDRIEAYLRMRIYQRYPFAGVCMPQGLFEGGYNGPDEFLAELVRPEFPDAGLYRWALEQPVAVADASPADPSISADPPTVHSHVARSYAVFSSDLADPNAVMMRMRVFPPGYGNGAGTFQTYLGGAFNIAGYGERLVIEKAGYHREEDYHHATSARRKSVVLLDDTSDESWVQVRGQFTSALLTGPVDYAELRTDAASSPEVASHAELGVDQTRRVFFVDRRFFIIVDTLESSTGDHQYDWLLHGATGGGSFVQDGAAGSALWTKPDGQRLLLRLVTPATFSEPAPTEVDYIDFDDDTGLAEPYVQARSGGTLVHFLAVVYPLDDAMTEPTITELTVNDAVAVEISGGASTGSVVVALRTGSAPLAPTAGFLCDTDALLCLYKLDAQSEPESLTIVEGTTGQLQSTAFQITLPSSGTAALVDAPGGPELTTATTLPPHEQP